MDKTELVEAMQQVRWAVVTLHDWREGGKGLKAIDEAIAFISSHDSVRDRVLEEAARERDLRLVEWLCCLLDEVKPDETTKAQAVKFLDAFNTGDGNGR